MNSTERRNIMKIGAFSVQQISKFTKGPNIGDSMNSSSELIQDKGSNMTQNKNQDLLAQHLPHEDIDIEEDEKASDEESYNEYEPDDGDEDEKRAGVYRSKGITVYVPEKCMTPGTRRPKIRELPKDMFDDIRIIYYK